MSLQFIIDSAQSIDIDRRKIVGQTISRSQRLRTAERQSSVAFKITVTPVARFRYSENRTELESLLLKDRFEETTINLANTQGLNYITKYQGGLTSGQLSSMTISSFTGTQVTFNNLPSVTSSTYLFRAGDFIQPTNSRYPYVISQDLQRGSGSLMTATVHRSLITSENIATTGTFLVGTATTLRLVVSELPTYRLIQKDWAEFSGDFVLVEKII
jgi:hypothetical protein